MKLISAITATVIIANSTSPAVAQDKFDYTDLISKDGSVVGATRIDIVKAYALHSKGVLFIDVNSPRNYKFAHIPGAVGLHFRTMITEENLAKYATKDQPIVFYCPRDGCYVVAQASAKAVSWGYTNVMIFEGGAAAWREAGYPFEEQ